MLLPISNRASKKKRKSIKNLVKIVTLVCMVLLISSKGLTFNQKKKIRLHIFFKVISPYFAFFLSFFFVKIV